MMRAPWILGEGGCPLSNAQRGNLHYERGVGLDNAGKTAEAIREFTRAIRASKHPMAYYVRACIYQDQREFKKAIRDFRGYLKHGSETGPEGIASRVCIEELEEKITASSKTRGKRSKHMCPLCKCNLIIVAEDVDGFQGSQKLTCPECGQTTIKL